MRVRVQPHKMGNTYSRDIARGIGALRVNIVHTTFVPRRGDIVINWGSARALFPEQHYINKPSAVNVAGNKLLALRAFQRAEVPCPEFTADPGEAYGWLTPKYEIQVLARTQLRSFQGRGIVPIYGGTEYSVEGDVFPAAPLYTKYKKKRHEYRVHVLDGEVLDVQQKRRRTGVEVNTAIRSYSGGWVFCREGVERKPCVIAAAVQAVSAVGLDFGAVDVGWNEREDSACVYEVNTAPAIEGTTLDKYVHAFRNLIESGN